MQGLEQYELTSKVTSQHQIQNKKTILIVLECVAQIDNEWMVDLQDRGSVN